MFSPTPNALSKSPRTWFGSIGLLAVVLGMGESQPTEAKDRALSFRYDVVPTLARQGCATAYCHGAATGQGGFKLSLFGSDPRQDYFAIRSAFDGRRIDLLHPERSLLLRKPARQVAHGGGRVLPRGSAAYRRVLRWLEQGAPWSVPDEASLASLRIRSVGAGELRAIAGFGSGATRVERDVTSLTRWSTTDRRVARVAEDGAPESNAGAAASLRIVGPGRAHVLARFGNLTARLPVLRPFAEPSARAKAHEPVPSQPNAAARSIDGAWHGGLARLGLVPAPPAGPLRVLRRVALDLVGRPPTLAELRQFEAEAGPRSQRIRRFAERWVASDEFAEVFGRHLAEWFELPDPLFFGERKDGRAAAASAVRQRVVDQLREGATVPAVLRELLRRREHVYRVADPRDRAELFGRTVLGLRIGCARCHDHPEDRWSRDDHQRFAALFAATDSTPEAGMVTSGLFDPTTGARITGRLPDRVASVPLPQRLRSPAGLVEGGVEWLAFEGAVDRLYRNLANRVVRVLFGRGLVEPVDDHRASNPAVDEDLLAVLTGRLAAAEGDLREFLTELVSSEFYATQSGLDAPRRRYLGAREVRALDAHALRRAARRAIGLEFVADRPLPSSPLARELDVLHGDAVFAALQGGDHLVDAIAQFGGSPREQIEDLWRLLLTRPPRVAEVERFLPALQQASDPGGVLRDLAFAILAGREFGSVR